MCRKVTSSTESIRIKAKIISCGHRAFQPPAQLFVSHITLFPTSFCCSFKGSEWSSTLISFILKKLQSFFCAQTRAFEKHRIFIFSHERCVLKHSAIPEDKILVFVVVFAFCSSVKPAKVVLQPRLLRSEQSNSEAVVTSSGACGCYNARKNRGIVE